MSRAIVTQRASLKEGAGWISVIPSRPIADLKIGLY